MGNVANAHSRHIRSYLSLNILVARSLYQADGNTSAKTIEYS